MGSAPEAEAAEATDRKTRKQISSPVPALFSTRIAGSGREGEWDLLRRESGCRRSQRDLKIGLLVEIPQTKKEKKGY